MQRSDSQPIDNAVYKRFKRAYAYAMAKTVDELSQAVEGMYHNLNTLN